MDWRQRLEHHLTRAWLRRGPTAWLLLPIALLYSSLNRLRGLAYHLGWLQSHRVDAKVLVVGNVVAGGAGKTPTVTAIARELQAQGVTVGIVSRGYGGATTSVQEVLPDSAAALVGDEPLLLRRTLQLPVFVGRDRVAAAQTLLKRYPATSVVVCDDGLQHLRLYRDLEVYVFDNRGVGNGWPLPSGPLRSPWPARWVSRVGQSPGRALVVHTGTHPAFDGHVATRRLQNYGVDQSGTQYPLHELAKGTRPCIAIAGIAQPHAFFDMLGDLGVPLHRCIPLPDHFDFRAWQPAWTQDGIILCTEKDAVKLWERFPQAIAVPLVQTMEPAFFAALLAHLAPPSYMAAPV